MSLNFEHLSPQQPQTLEQQDGPCVEVLPHCHCLWQQRVWFHQCVTDILFHFFLFHFTWVNRTWHRGGPVQCVKSFLLFSFPLRWHNSRKCSILWWIGFIFSLQVTFSSHMSCWPESTLHCVDGIANNRNAKILPKRPLANIHLLIILSLALSQCFDNIKAHITG